MANIQVPVVQQAIETRPMASNAVQYDVRTQPESGLNNLAGAIGEIGLKAKDQADTSSLLAAQQQMDAWEAKNIFDPMTGALSKKGKDAFDLPNTLGVQYQSDMKQIHDSLGNNDQQTAFEKMAIQRQGTIMQTLYAHERVQMDDYAKNNATGARDSATNRATLYFNKPDVVDSAISDGKAAQLAFDRYQGLPDNMIQQNQLAVESKARLGVMTRMADADPRSAIDYYNTHQGSLTAEDMLSAQRLIAPTERKYKATNVASNVLATTAPKIDQNGVIDYVMNNLEGGDKVITDGNGAIAKFGINAKANPDLDVANLTADQAKQRYVSNYWNKINGDSLSPDMRLPAMSFAATSGTGPTNDLIEKSGGDPRKFQELAAGYYQDLATKNPEKYAGNLQGWMNRLANVSAQVDVMHGQLPNEVDLYKQIDAQTNDVQVATDAKELVNKQLEAVKKAKEDSYKAASTEAWKYKTNGMEVPPSVVAKMNPKDAEEMQKNASPDPAVYEDARQKILSGLPVDLQSMRWRLGSKYNDLVELAADPVKQSQNSVVDNTVKTALPAILGHSTIKTSDDYAKVEQFRLAVKNEVQAQQKLSGKTLSGDDVQRVVDKQLLTTSGGLWSSKKLYQAKPGQQVSVDSIPATGTHLIQGQPFSQAQVLDVILRNLAANHMPISDDNVKMVYKRLLSTGQIQYTYDQRQ